MDRTDVVVVRTGTANLASVLAGLERIGARARLSEDAADVDRAAKLVLPGVGTLAAAMAQLRANGLDRALRRRVEQGRPTLAICLGLQMLCEASDESPGERGLGIIPGRATRFSNGAGSGLRVPQLGWNGISARSGCRLLQDGHAYFANSYRLAEPPPGWRVALADYGGPFVAAVERGPVLACQFHPELSGSFGMGLLRRWFEAGVDGGGASC